MILAITGNPSKERLWDPVAELINRLSERGMRFCVEKVVADGLLERGLISRERCTETRSENIAAEGDIIISFGGDGTLLRTAHLVGHQEKPVLGVNIGRLGFLADIEVNSLDEALDRLENKQFTVEARNVLSARLMTSHNNATEDVQLPRQWALNEFVLDRSGASGLIRIDVEVDGTHLNQYWADGLIFASPTGSTAYSLSAGGPILVPGTDAMVLTPIAPHTLTVRPVVLPGNATITARVKHDGEPYVLAADGTNYIVEEEEVTVTIEKADHAVHLVKFNGMSYFETLRSKLMWGA